MSLMDNYERADIKHLVSADEWTQYQQQVEHLLPSADFEVRRRTELHRRIESYQSSLSPICRLPPENLAEIFCSLLAGITYSRPNPKEAPLLICQVCCFWRQVAIDTPKLWVNLQMQFRTSVKRSATHYNDGPTNLLQLWLSRSKVSPLSLSLSATGVFVRHYKIVEALLPHTTKVQKIYLNLSSSLIQSLFELPPKSWAQLEELNIRLPPEYAGDPWKSPATAFLSALHLRTVKLVSIGAAPFSYESLNLPWSQLTDIKISLLNLPRTLASSFFSELISTRNLTINIQGWGNEQIPPPLPSPIELPELLSFDLQFADRDLSSSSQLFLLLILPNLTSLKLRTAEPWHHPDFASFQSRSDFRHLERLSLHLVGIKSHELELVLRDTPILLDLALSDCDCDDTHFFEMLTHTVPPVESATGAHVTIVPLLNILHVVTEGSFGDEVVATMIESRMNLKDSNGKPHLRTVYIEIQTRDFGVEIEKRLEQYCNEGLHLTLEGWDALDS